MMLDALLVLGCMVIVLELFGLGEIIIAMRDGRLPSRPGPAYLLGVIAFAWTVPLRRLNVLTWWLWHVKIKRDLYLWRRDKKDGD